MSATTTTTSSTTSRKNPVSLTAVVILLAVLVTAGMTFTMTPSLSSLSASVISSSINHMKLPLAANNELRLGGDDASSTSRSQETNGSDTRTAITTTTTTTSDATTTIGNKTTSSNSSSKPPTTTPPMTTYTFVPKNQINYAEPWDSCDPGKFCNKFGRHCQRRKALFPLLQQLTNFSTTLDLGTNDVSQSSNKLLVLGDSVGMQFFHMLDRASSAASFKTHNRKRHNRTVLEYAFGEHISYAVSGDGKLGAWRTTGMFLKENEGKPPPNEPDGGWNRTTAQALLNVVVPGADDKAATPIGSFDVVLFRIPHGWLKLHQITTKGIIESLQLAHEVFGVTKAILLTLPFNNNVHTHLISEWRSKNDDIRRLVTTFQSNKETIPGIDRLVLMDLAELTNQFIHRNARYLGYLNDTNDDENMPYLNVRLVDYIPKVLPAAAHVCSGPLAKENTRLLCDKNAITADGLHVCPNTYGGHFVAATGCLLQCLESTATTPQNASLDCQTNCNDKYMTLKRIFH